MTADWVLRVPALFAEPDSWLQHQQPRQGRPKGHLLLWSQIHGLGADAFITRLGSAPRDDVDFDAQEFLKVLEHTHVINKKGTGDWGELNLRRATPDAGSELTDDASPRERRPLKHRAEGDSRIVPVHPELTKLLRDHLNQFGTAPAADSSAVCGAASCRRSPTVVRGSKLGGRPLRVRASLSPGSAALRSPRIVRGSARPAQPWASSNRSQVPRLTCGPIAAIVKVSTL